MTAAIDIRDLHHAYKEAVILKNLTFAIPKGLFFIVIGPNGSGKTTLLKTLAGVERLQEGRIEISGAALGSYSRRALARQIALVPQTVQIDFPFTVLEVILMGRAPHLGMLGLEQPQDLEVARQAMTFMEVDGLANRQLDQLSGGERQRVFIARALCQDPRIILLDEPTASLDIGHQILVMDLMQKLKQDRAITVVMVSHDINLAAMYGDRLLLLQEGRILAAGRPEQVLTFETLEQAYGCAVLVDENPLGGIPRVTPVPGRMTKNYRK